MSAAQLDRFAADDLTWARPKDADRLAKAEAELAKREAALQAAEDQRDAAKAAVLAAGVGGKDDSKAAAALSAANADVATARELRDLRREVLDTIKAEIVAEVRGRRSAEVLAKLDRVRAQYDDQVRLYADVLAIASNLDKLAAAEARLAAELAMARREGIDDPVHGYVAGSGGRYRTIPDVRVGFHLIVNGNRDEVESDPDHLVDRLRRRE